MRTHAHAHTHTHTHAQTLIKCLALTPTVTLADLLDGDQTDSKGGNLMRKSKGEAGLDQERVIKERGGNGEEERRGEGHRFFSPCCHNRPHLFTMVCVCVYIAFC